MTITYPSDDTPVSERWNTVFRAISQEPRRELVITLANKSAAHWVTLPDAARSPHYGGSEDDLRSELYHKHLPLLSEHNYVVWEGSPFEVRQGPNFAELEVVVRAIAASVDELPRQMVDECRLLEKRRDAP